MARRKPRQLIDPKMALSLLIALGVIWAIAQILQQVSRISSGELGLVILIGGAAALAFPVVRHLRRVKSQRAILESRRILLQKTHAIVEQHINALAIRMKQLVTQDAYGKFQFEQWWKEIDYFITQIVEPSLAPNERAELQSERSTIANFINARTIAAMQSQPVFQAFSDTMSPTEFEIFCAEELRRAGWSARVTRQSRDQGVDVVAEKGDVRVVIQCKLYTRPVGNKAVQQAVAAKAHERATHGAVVTNNKYTLDAEQLASTNGILLLHYGDLRNLHDILHQRQV